MPHKNIYINYLRGCTIFALDIGYLLQDSWSSDLIDERTSTEWLGGLRHELANWERFGLAAPEFVESEYGKTDRASRNTFAQKYTKRLLPLSLRLSKPDKYTEKNITYHADSIRLSPQGGISVRIIFELQSGTSLSVKDTIDNYNQMLIKVPTLLKKTFGVFTGFWNANSLSAKLIHPPSELLREILLSYEIIDFDFSLVCTDGKASEVTSIKSLLVDSDKVPACELAAIAKMSPVSATALNDARLQEFIETDIGGRDDELWAINRDRMIRRHPERNIIYNKAFLDDIKTACGILICQKATFDFLEEWIARRRSIVVKQMVNYGDLDKVERASFQRQFGEVISISQLLVEPIMLQKNVKHAFYIQAVTEVAKHLGMHTASERASRSIRDFTQLIESVAGYREAELTASMSNIQIQLGKSAKRIGYVTIWITIIGIILTLVQVYLAFAIP